MGEIQRRSRWLKALATAILAVLLLALGVEAAIIAGADDPGAGLRFTLPYRLPMLFYLAAIWTMRRAFAQLARGILFDRILPTLLSRVGMALAAGATASVFVTPWLLRLLDGPRRGAFAAFDPPAITIGLVGLLLVILSRLIVRAVAMQRDLDGIL